MDLWMLLTEDLALHLTLARQKLGDQQEAVHAPSMLVTDGEAEVVLGGTCHLIAEELADALSSARVNYTMNGMNAQNSAIGDEASEAEEIVDVMLEVAFPAAEEERRTKGLRCHLECFSFLEGDSDRKVGHPGLQKRCHQLSLLPFSLVRCRCA